MGWRYVVGGAAAMLLAAATGSVRLGADLPIEPIATASVLPNLRQADFDDVGFPVTGLTRKDDGTWWAGWGLGKASPNGGAVHLSSDFKQVLGSVHASELGLPAGATQGITVDDGTVWFILKRTPKALLVQVSGEGALLRSFALPDETSNGLTLDTKRNQLIVMNDGGLMTWLDKLTLRPTGQTLKFDAKAPDQLAYDEASDRLFVSHGVNHENGSLTEFVQKNGRWEPGSSWVLGGADAIEGIWVEGKTVTVTNDSATHNGRPALNRVMTYRIGQP